MPTRHEREVGLGMIGGSEAFALYADHTVFVKLVRPGTDDGPEFDVHLLAEKLGGKLVPKEAAMGPLDYRRHHRLDAALKAATRGVRSLMVCVVLTEEPDGDRCRALASHGVTVPIDGRPRMTFMGTLAPEDVEALEATGWVYKILCEGAALPLGRCGSPG